MVQYRNFARKTGKAGKKSGENSYYHQRRQAEELFHYKEESKQPQADQGAGGGVNEVEKFYAEKDDGETAHWTKRMVTSSYDVKTLDVRILELKEEPENIELLLTVLSLILEEVHMHMDKQDAFKPLKDFDLVNYVLASALKADKIPPEALGMVIVYLEAVEAPSIYFQYAILRVHQNLNACRLIDISTTVSNCHHLADEGKIMKILDRVQTHIEVTNEKLLKAHETNFRAVFSLYQQFALFELGTPQFFQKLESLLEKDIVKKTYQLDADDCVALAHALALKQCRNQTIWQALLRDMSGALHLGGVSNVQIFYLMRALHACGLLDGDAASGLVEYIVKRGYDSDDLIALSSKKGGYRRAIHFISMVADSKPDLKNKHFLTHVAAFARAVYKDLPALQNIRLLTALRKLKSFKNQRLVNDLQKLALGKSIAPGAAGGLNEEELMSERLANQTRMRPEDPGYFTAGDSEQEEAEFGYDARARADTDFDIDDEEFRRHEEKVRAEYGQEPRRNNNV